MLTGVQSALTLSDLHANAKGENRLSSHLACNSDKLTFSETGRLAGLILSTVKADSSACDLAVVIDCSLQVDNDRLSFAQCIICDRYDLL